jgi:hypothetical protein
MPVQDVKAALKSRLGQQDLVELDEQEQAAIRARMEAVDKLFAGTNQAKYKLEIQFNEKRSMWQPYVGVMYFLLSGNKLHGGGDTKIYLCGQEGCHGIVNPPEHTVTDLDTPEGQESRPRVVCPKCNQIQLADQLWGERLLRLTAQNWAKAIYDNFRYLEQNADVMLILHHSDLQKMTRLEMEKNASSAILDGARRARQKVIYPLKNLIKDVSTGADMHQRFLAFVNS